MPPVSSYRELLVWQRSIDLAVLIYKISSDFPSEERYGMANQIRRASVSIPANIAEGQARRTSGEFLQSLSVAQGSLAEVETFLVLSAKLGYVSEQDQDSLLEPYVELNKMLTALMRSIQARQ